MMNLVAAGIGLFVLLVLVAIYAREP